MSVSGVLLIVISVSIVLYFYKKYRGYYSITTVSILKNIFKQFANTLYYAFREHMMKYWK